MPNANAGSINLHYETFGDGDPLLLIMGLGLPGAVWVPSLPMLPGFRCVYFDNRGTGESDQPPGPYTAHDMAEDTSGLLKALGIARSRVFGVSMGGMIAQELALNHPEQVERLVLGCTWAGGPTTKLAPPETVEKLMLGSSMMASDPDKALDVILPLLFPPDFIASQPQIKQMMSAAMSSTPRTPPQTVVNQLMGVAQFNAYDRLQQIKCPVLIVHGDKDTLIPCENAWIIKSKIPHAELFIIPGAAHAFQAADPVGVHRRIVEFLRN